MAPRTRFYQAIFHSEGALQSSHHYSLALCRYHLSLATTMLVGLGLAPGLHSNTSSSARRSVWHPRSTDVSYARRKSSPMMNSFVILAKNSQYFSGHHPKLCQENFLQDAVDLAIYCLQRVTLVWLPFGPSGGDVGPSHSHVRPGVHSHEAWFVTDPDLCD
jgi:hypothetical protein